MTAPVVTAAMILADGTEVDTWDRYTITLDMLRAGNAWTFSLWHSTTRATTWSVLRRKVRVGDPLTVTLGGAAQVSGRIETVETHVDRKGATMVISGRDLGGVAESWDADPTVRLRGLPLSDALRSLFTPLGIPVAVSVSADAVRSVQSGTTRNARGVSHGATRRRSQPIDMSHPRAGEKVWRLADGLCRRVGYLMWIAPADNGALAVVVDTPAYSTPDVYDFTRSPGPNGTMTGNILSTVERIDTKGVPTEVNVYSGTVRGDLISSRQRSQTFNLALANEEITRGMVADPMPDQVRHVHAVRARTNAVAAREAERIIAEAMASFRSVDVTVQGHAQTVDGATRLYAVNTMARVRDAIATDPEGRALDESMLITRVVFDGSRESGTTTRLTLSPRGAITVVPEGEAA